MGRRPSQPRTVWNDLRLIANYCRPLAKIAGRITAEEIEALPAEDLWFLRSWVDDTTAVLNGLADWCASEERRRHEDSASGPQEPPGAPQTTEEDTHDLRP